MQIRVGLNASLRRFLPEGTDKSPFPLEVDRELTALEVMEILGVPSDRAHIVTIDGEQVGAETKVREGQEVSFFPPLAGGS